MQACDLIKQVKLTQKMFLIRKTNIKKPQLRGFFIVISFVFLDNNQPNLTRLCTPVLHIQTRLIFARSLKTLIAHLAIGFLCGRVFLAHKQKWGCRILLCQQPLFLSRLWLFVKLA